MTELRSCEGCGARDFERKEEFYVCNYCKRQSPQLPINLRQGIVSRTPLSQNYYCSTAIVSYSLVSTSTVNDLRTAF